MTVSLARLHWGHCTFQLPIHYQLPPTAHEECGTWLKGIPPVTDTTISLVRDFSRVLRGGELNQFIIFSHSPHPPRQLVHLWRLQPHMWTLIRRPHSSSLLCATHAWRRLRQRQHQVGGCELLLQEGQEWGGWRHKGFPWLSLEKKIKALNFREGICFT